MSLNYLLQADWQLPGITEVITARLYWRPSIDYSGWTMAYFDHGRGGPRHRDFNGSTYSQNQGCKSPLPGCRIANNAGHYRNYIPLAVLSLLTTNTHHMPYVHDDPILSITLISTSWFPSTIPHLYASTTQSTHGSDSCLDHLTGRYAARNWIFRWSSQSLGFRGRIRDAYVQRTRRTSLGCQIQLFLRWG